MHEVIIVGSGPAGTAAALQLAGRDVLMLDVGYDVPKVPEFFSGDLQSLRQTQSDLFSSLIGDDFDSLINVFAERRLSLKLKSPYMRYITHRAQELTRLASRNFEGTVSLAKGGLANAWGAGAYRYTDEDLKEFPLTYSDLSPYYDKLTEHIGISGDNDDLTPWFRHDPGLQPPIRLGEMAAGLLERYEKRRPSFNKEGVYIGRTRLAVITKEHRGRQPYDYGHMEFFKPHIPAIYAPAYTLNELVASRQIDYRPGWLVESFQESADKVSVQARHIDTGEAREFPCRRLLLGAGALNTARIALASARDTQSRLPVLDNPMSAFPVFRLDRIGKALDPYDASVGQLNMICQTQDAGTKQVSFYGTGGSLRTDVLFDLPLPVTAARNLLKYTGAATAVAMVFYPGVRRPQNYVRLMGDGALEVQYEAEPHDGETERKLIRLLGGVGYRSHPKLAQYLPMGSGIHYAGMLPMRAKPGPYECDPNGCLAGTRGVHVIDGACFSALPAKNLTFTIMANAMRIAQQACQEA